MKHHSCITVLIAVVGIAASFFPNTAPAADQPVVLSPQLCQQLGGALPCQPAQPGAWTYRIENATFKSEATAYAHMLDLYGPSSVFALAHRWGKVNPNPGEPEQAHSFDTMSWKMYYRECSAHADSASCDEFPRYTGYQRVREIACPAGYRFSSDASSPFCIPGDAAASMAQMNAPAVSHGLGRSALRTAATP